MLLLNFTECDFPAPLKLKRKMFCGDQPGGGSGGQLTPEAAEEQAAKAEAAEERRSAMLAQVKCCSLPRASTFFNGQWWGSGTVLGALPGPKSATCCLMRKSAAAARGHASQQLCLAFPVAIREELL